jgi:hypothetical protein
MTKDTLETNFKCGVSSIDVQVQLSDEDFCNVQSWFTTMDKEMFTDMAMFKFLYETVLMHSLLKGGPIKTECMSKVATWAYLTTRNLDGLKETMPNLYKWVCENGGVTKDLNPLKAKVMNCPVVDLTKCSSILCPLVFFDFGFMKFKPTAYATVTCSIKKYTLAHTQSLAMYPSVFLAFDQDMNDRSVVEPALIEALFGIPTTYSNACSHTEMNKIETAFYDVEDEFLKMPKLKCTDKNHFLYSLLLKTLSRDKDMLVLKNNAMPLFFDMLMPGLNDLTKLAHIKFGEMDTAKTRAYFMDTFSSKLKYVPCGKEMVMVSIQSMLKNVAKTFNGPDGEPVLAEGDEYVFAFKSSAFEKKD